MKKHTIIVHRDEEALAHQLYGTRYDIVVAQDIDTGVKPFDPKQGFKHLQTQHTKSRSKR